MKKPRKAISVLSKYYKYEIKKRISRTMNTLVQIHNINLIGDADNGPVSGYSIDEPSRTYRNDAHFIDVSGWVIARNGRVLSVELLVNGQLMKSVPLTIPREDVGKLFPAHNHLAHCGFAAQLGTLGLPEAFIIEVKAVLKAECVDDRIRAPLARISGKRVLHSNCILAKRQPLMLTSMPRSGTTWVMRMLSKLPKVAVHDRYPFEMRAAIYWMHTLKVLSDPADYHRSTVPDNFERDMAMIGQNPYYHQGYMRPDHMGLVNAFGKKTVSNLIECCVKNIDAIYDEVEESQGKEGTLFFAEKQMPSHVQNLFWEIYESPREIVLVRDLRDVICSAMHFNAKRGTKEFGRGLVDSDRAWIARMRENLFERILNKVNVKGDNVLLVRYEDLVSNSFNTLGRIEAYLDLDLDEKSLQAVIHAASASDGQMAHHQTSHNTSKSISRWRTDMDDATKALCTELLGDALLALGYESN